MNLQKNINYEKNRSRTICIRISTILQRSANEKSAVKFTPPVIVKDTPTSKSNEKVNFTPPVIKKDEVAKDEEVKFTPPVIKKDHPTKKKSPVKFTPPVIVKDKSKK